MASRNKSERKKTGTTSHWDNFPPQLKQTPNTKGEGAHLANESQYKETLASAAIPRTGGCRNKNNGTKISFTTPSRVCYLMHTALSFVFLVLCGFFFRLLFRLSLALHDLSNVSSWKKRGQHIALEAALSAVPQRTW